MNDARSELMRKSINSLIKTTAKLDIELMVGDNGGSMSDSSFLLELTDFGSIACYTRYRNNIHFPKLRNEMMQKATGDYIVIVDNDIVFNEGWLEDCIDFLLSNPGKYMATPLTPDSMGVKVRYQMAPVDGWDIHLRAGSNCFVMSRESFEEIGLFDLHNVAGSKYVDRYIKLGYKMACSPFPKAFDYGLRSGYDYKRPTYSEEL